MLQARSLVVGLVLMVWLLDARTSLAQDVSLHLNDGTEDEMVALEIGRNLSARLTGLEPGQQVSLVVRDEYGGAVVTVNGIADTLGEVEVAPLWIATGIVGCDCSVEVGAYQFQRAENALLTLNGGIFEVQVTDVIGNELVATAFSLVAPSRPIALAADGTGCPRFRFQDSESLYLLILGGTAGLQSSVTVAPGLTGPISEVRSNKPEGPSFGLSGQAFEVILLWPESLTTPGGYRVFVTGSGWPTPKQYAGGPINSGAVVEDHPCPPAQIFP